MKAYVLHGIGRIGLEERPRPEAGGNEALVAVRAAGVCGSDIPRIYRTGAYHYPLIPGHEFSGVVCEAGEGADASWPGRRVGVYPLLPCRKCGPCRQDSYELCRSYGYLGSRTDGGFAEYVRVPLWNLVPLPDNVSFEQAAMLEPMAVAAHAMRSLGPALAGRVAVCGLGTVGMLLLMLLKERGVSDLLAIGNKGIQREKALELGVPEGDYFDVRLGNVDEWLERKAGEKEIDAFVDCAGSVEAAAWGMRHAAPGGRVALVGNPASDMGFDRQTWWKVLRNQLTIAGVWNSSFTHKETDDWHYCLDRLGQGKIHPERLITHRLPFEKLKEGIEMARDRAEEHIKIMGILR